MLIETVMKHHEIYDKKPNTEKRLPVHVLEILIPAMVN